LNGFREMLVGYARISTSEDRQSTDLQRDALRSAGVGGRPRKLDDERIDAARSLMKNGMTVLAAARSMGLPRLTLVDSLRRNPPQQVDSAIESSNSY
jgi:DNA invertase Pin-like site-specific DNA recombinase